MRPWNEAERTFYEDIREKKKAASGVHHKTGKNGYVGNMRFPTDIMSRKDKYNYRKAGKIVISNLYENILPIDEFNRLDREEQKQRMLFWRTNYSNVEIRQNMKIANATYYRIVAELELPKAPRGKSARTTIKKPINKMKEEITPIIETKQIPDPPPAVQEMIIEGLHVVFNGTFSAEHIIKQLSKFELILDGEPDQFNIELKITQKPNKKEGAF